MLVDVYISENLYRVVSIGIPSIDKSLITYVRINPNYKMPILKLYRADEYFRLFVNKKGLAYFSEEDSSIFQVDAVIYDEVRITSTSKYIYLPKYDCSSTFNIKEPTEELVKKYIEGYKCL